MWQSWGKSTVRIQNKSSSPSSSFSCSSFKDIQSLCLDEPPKPSSCRAATVFHRVRVANSLLRAWSAPQQQQPKLPKPVSHPASKSDAAASDPPTRSLTVQTDTPPSPPPPTPTLSIPGAEQRIVVYYTSLRVVRSTFEDCRSVRFILRGFRVKIDERDVSMDAGYMRELKSILGQKKVTLPRVFIAGRYIGGAEEVRQLNEIGELKKIVEALPAAELGACDVCGGYRFILCEECNGSRKMYTEKAGFKICTACNENGLISIGSNESVGSSSSRLVWEATSTVSNLWSASWWTPQAALPDGSKLCDHSVAHDSTALEVLQATLISHGTVNVAGCCIIEK